MSLSDETYQGRVGRRRFLINARDARAAVALAMEFSADHSFITEEIFQHAYPVESLPMWGSKPFEPFEGLEGAWAIGVARVGHAWSSSGSEYDSDYHIESIEFESAEPHVQPHYEDDPGHWAQVRLSRAEKRLIDGDTPKPHSLPPTRKTL